MLPSSWKMLVVDQYIAFKDTVNSSHRTVTLSTWYALSSLHTISKGQAVKCVWQIA